MIVEATAPTRIDLAGGTLDIYPIYLLEDGALTINLAITIGTRARLEPYSGGVAVCAQDLGIGVEAPTAEALPAGGPLDLVLRAVRYCGLPARTRVVTVSQAPQGSGLGASSSLLVALLAACARWRGRPAGFPPSRTRWGRRSAGFLPPPARPLASRGTVSLIRSPRPDLVDLASRLEAQSINAPTGKQDYYAALHGGLNAIWFGLDETVVEPLLPPRRLGGLADHLVLTFTGAPHASGLTNWSMLRAYLDGVPGTTQGLRAIGRISREMRDALRQGDLRACARLLRAEWEQRRRLAEGVSTPQVERAMAIARRAGALASKVCGAGGGGCVVSLVPAERRSMVERALDEAGFRVLPFRAARRGLRVVTRPSPGTRRAG
jgi:D-glycero-alpha-D-manno-heptose-7-phosphate kinase